MTIRFRLTPKDLVAFYTHQFLSSPVAVIGYVACVAALLLFGVFKEHSWPAGIINAVAGAVLMLLFFRIQMELTARSKSNRKSLVDLALTVGEEGLSTESTHGKSDARWSIVQKVARTKRHFFLHVSGTSAVTIPIAAFASAQEADDFWALCLRKTNAPIPG